MLAIIDVAVAAPETVALQWGVAQAAAALPSLAFVLAGLLACVVPALAQEPAEEPPPAAEPAPAPPPLQAIPVEAEEEPVATPEGAVELDRIEVTASKRLKAQRDIPGSVGAIRGEDLERMRAQSMSDYLKLVPGISITDYGSGQQIPVIRGIASQTDGSSFTGYTAGLYLEEMPFNDLFLPLSVPDLNPFDLERVEVLKGPQGTLFGASALAGAIRYIVQKPNLGVWQAKATTTFLQNEHSEEPSRVGATAVNVPIGDSAALRVVGLYRAESGLYDSRPSGDNPDTPEQEGNTRDEKDIDRFDQMTGRALLRWDLTDTLSASAMAFGQDTQQDDNGSANNPTRFERNDVPFPSPTRSRFQGGNFTLANEFDFGRVTYIGNVVEKRFKTRAQTEPALPEQLGNQEDVSWYTYVKSVISGYAHEARLSSPEGGDDSPWEWLVGAAYFSYDQAFFQFTPNPGDPDSGYYANNPEEPGDVAEADQFGSFLWATVDAVATESALFGEVTGRLGEHWEATVGARAFETTIVADTLFRGQQINALEPGSTESGAHFDMKEEGINPKVSLRYLHDRSIQAYALVARGFQFGGVQLNPPIANAEQASEAKGFRFGPYDSSVLWNYELGLRTEWLDRRLRFDLAAFYLDWTDLQITLQVPLNPQPIPAPPGSGIPQNVNLDVIVNVGAAHSEGLEAALEVVPFAGATFASTVAWISALTDEAFDPDNPAGPVPAGTRLPGTPRFQWANVFEYESALPYFTSFAGGFALTHSHIGESPNDLRPNKNVGGYDTLDVRFDLTRPGQAWFPEIGLGVNNLTDVRGFSAYNGDTSVTNFYFLVRPRTTLVTLAWSF